MDILNSFSRIRGGVAVDVFVQLMDNLLRLILTSDVFNVGYKILIPTGCALCVIYCCVELIDKTSHQSFNLENILLQLLKFFAVYALVSNIDTIIMGFGELVTAINSEVINYLTDLNGLNQLIENNNKVITASASINSTAGNTSMQINRALSTVFNVIIQVMIIKIGVERAIVIGAKSLIAPIIVPDIYHNGMNSTGIKFLKGLLGDYFTTTMTIFIIEMCCIVAFTDVQAAEPTHYLPSGTIIKGFTALVVLYGGLKNTREKAQQVIMGTLD